MGNDGKPLQMAATSYETEDEAMERLEAAFERASRCRGIFTVFGGMEDEEGEPYAERALVRWAARRKLTIEPIDTGRGTFWNVTLIVKLSPTRRSRIEVYVRRPVSA